MWELPAEDQSFGSGFTAGSAVAAAPEGPLLSLVTWPLDFESGAGIPEVALASVLAAAAAASGAGASAAVPLLVLTSLMEVTVRPNSFPESNAGS